MKVIQYLSPTGIMKYEENPDEYYLMYLADHRPPKIPQTKPMSVGSSFDAHIKSYLHEALFGKDKNPKFGLQALFEAQVEPHNRDFAYGAGKKCFDVYKQCGAVSDLMQQLSGAVGEPRFEIEIKGVIEGQREGVTLDTLGVTLLGKPDVFFINNHGAHVILDWKVNGYCSQWGASPKPGYVNIRNDPKKTGCHPDAFVQMHNGMLINIGTYLETVDRQWGLQLSIYGWLCGEEIGNDFIVGIDQLACRNGDIRVAQHRLRASSKFQWDVYVKAQQIWEIVHSNHFFRDMTFEESAKRCQLLEEQAQALMATADSRDEWFAKITRGM